MTDYLSDYLWKPHQLLCDKTYHSGCFLLYTLAVDVVAMDTVLPCDEVG